MSARSLPAQFSPTTPASMWAMATSSVRSAAGTPRSRTTSGVTRTSVPCSRAPAASPSSSAFERRRPVVAERGGVGRGGEDGFGITHAVGGEVGADLEAEPSEVVELRQQVAQGDVLLDEVEEAVEPPPVGAEPGRRGHAVAIGELERGRDAHRTLEVDVQLDLGQRAQIPHASDAIGRPARRWRCGRASIAGAARVPELVDGGALKAPAREGVWVRPPPRAQCDSPISAGRRPSWSVVPAELISARANQVLTEDAVGDAQDTLASLPRPWIVAHDDSYLMRRHGGEARCALESMLGPTNPVLPGRIPAPAPSRAGRRRRSQLAPVSQGENRPKTMLAPSAGVRA